VVLSHRYRFIFIKTKKTAGTSIEVFLSEICADDDVLTPIRPRVAPHRPRNYAGSFNPLPELIATRGRSIFSTFKELRHRRRYYNHIPALKVRARVPRSVWNGYFKFCVERNPWDKTLSHYHWARHERAGALTFDEYLTTGRFCVNHPRYTDPSGRTIVDRVLRYERLNEDLGETFEALGIPFCGDLGVRAKARPVRGDYRRAYTDAQRKLIARRFAEEIRLHGYTF
jgi:hypothetical protein